MSGKRFPSVRRIVETVLYGPEPVGQAGAGVLYRYEAGQLGGGRMGGYPHYGMRGDPSLTFSGYVASPQEFQGAAQLGASTNLSVQAYPALPSATTPKALPTWLQDWTALEGVVP
jgi:hypothetical protein